MMTGSRTRRGVLLSAAGGVAALSGCSALSGGSDESNRTGPLRFKRSSSYSSQPENVLDVPFRSDYQVGVSQLVRSQSEYESVDWASISFDLDRWWEETDFDFEQELLAVLVFRVDVNELAEGRGGTFESTVHDGVLTYRLESEEWPPLLDDEYLLVVERWEITGEEGVPTDLALEVVY